SARHQGGGCAYAASSAFKHWLTLRISERTITNGQIRAKWVVGATEREIGQARRTTYHHAEQVSNRERYFTCWQTLPPCITQLIERLVQGNNATQQLPTSLIQLSQRRASEF